MRINIKRIFTFLLTASVLFILIISTVSAEVPKILQNPELPSGCEATAAAAWLQHYGYTYTKHDMWNYLPKENVRYEYHPELKKQVLVGPSMNEKFAVNAARIDSKSGKLLGGYGMYSKGMEQTLSKLLSEIYSTDKILLRTGCSVEKLFEYLEDGPLLVWATLYMWEVNTKNNVSWYIKKSDGTYTKERETWINNEHCLVLISATKTTVKLMDPMQGIVEYPRATFISRWQAQGSHVLQLEKGPVFKVNNYLLRFKNPPVEKNGDIYFSLREICSFLGLTYEKNGWFITIEAANINKKHNLYIGDMTYVRIDGEYMVNGDYLDKIKTNVLWCTYSHNYGERNQ